MTDDALITNLERGSTVDGPGIRLVIFLKGCPLHCLWCHNPETISRKPEIMRDLKRCTGCRLCHERTPERAVAECPEHAAELVGRMLSLNDFSASVNRDMKFIKKGGGVTFSGGEPLLQAEWVAAAAKICRKSGIHTALDTTLYAAPETIECVSENISLFMVDLKHANPQEHKRFTGVSNVPILENLKRLDMSGHSILLRTPLIPGINDSPDNLEAMLDIAGTLRHLIRYEFLSYNPLTPFKYEKLGRKFPLMLGEEENSFTLKKLLDVYDFPAVLIK